MSKRSTNNLRSQQELRIDQNRNYGCYIKDEQKKQHAKQVNHITHANHQSDAILRDPNANDARRCFECECTNSLGFCDNYFLYAVIRGICRVPVKEAVNE